MKSSLLSRVRSMYKNGCSKSNFVHVGWRGSYMNFSPIKVISTCKPIHNWEEILLINGSYNAHLSYLNIIIYYFTKSWVKLEVQNYSKDPLSSKIKHKICSFRVFCATFICQVLLLVGAGGGSGAVRWGDGGWLGPHSLICQKQFDPFILYSKYIVVFILYILSECCSLTHFHSIYRMYSSVR